MPGNKAHKTGRNTAESTPTTSRLTSFAGDLHEDDETQHDTPTLQRQSSTATTRRAYGTLESSEGSLRQRSSQQRTDSTQHFPPLSPQISRQKRPPVARRPSGRKQYPYRGEQFSVDDDPTEVEEDRAEQFPPLKKSSTITRHRSTAHAPTLPRVESEEVASEDPHISIDNVDARRASADTLDEGDDTEFDVDNDSVVSDAESFTLKDRQLAINETHPFGIRIWKPALYKKNRSVEKNAEEDIHSSPSQIVSRWLWIANGLWTIMFGWWLAALAALAALFCFLFIFEQSAVEYSRVFWGLAGYLFWPFGKLVRLEQDDQYLDEDEGAGRSITEYERWQSGDLEYGRLMFGPSTGNTGSIVGRRRNSIESASERDHLLGRNGVADTATVENDENEEISTKPKRRLFGRGQWTLGRIVFFGFFYFLIAPSMLAVSLMCWFLVFTIPMGRVLLILFHHLRRRPLSLSFHPDMSSVRDSHKHSTILLCTYRAAGLKYWKYTIDGTNIFLINFNVLVIFVIVDYFLLDQVLGLEIWITSPGLIFGLSLVSVVPLAYFIGQAVASISAQSSMGMGAAVNAFFSTVVEVYLYCVALNEGKGLLVEGSVIGSIFAGLLLLPGLSMCFGAIKRKTQRFNVKSAGATTTMLLFAVIATFGPTLFYKIYGSHELICQSCSSPQGEKDCRRCYFRQIPAITDDFFIQAVQPYCWGAAVSLFLSYIIGLLFTLRTHAAIIWTTDTDEKKPSPAHNIDLGPTETRFPSIGPSPIPGANGQHPRRLSIRESQLYNRILGQSLRSAGMLSEEHNDHHVQGEGDEAKETSHEADTRSLPHRVPPKTSIEGTNFQATIPGLTAEENNTLVHQVAELAATAATIAARDVVQHPKAASFQLTHPTKHDSLKSKKPSGVHFSGAAGESSAPGGIATSGHPTGLSIGHDAVGAHTEHENHGGHDAPNWSRTKSSVILLVATVAYAIVAEILVDTVDVILKSVTIDEKFLGFTLFALVPNTTEFLNAISFAMNGNIALSMEIGSAYVLQVCLLQIPALVLFTAVRGRWINPESPLGYTFNLIFPQWDMVTVILCVFLLSYVYSEGRSNYFKGSILVLTYLVVMLGFWLSSYTTFDIMGVDPSDTLAIMASGWSRPHESLNDEGNAWKKIDL